jgi:hypothetical protein
MVEAFEQGHIFRRANMRGSFMDGLGCQHETFLAVSMPQFTAGVEYLRSERESIKDIIIKKSNVSRARGCSATANVSRTSAGWLQIRSSKAAVTGRLGACSTRSPLAPNAEDIVPETSSI